MKKTSIGLRAALGLVLGAMAAAPALAESRLERGRYLRQSVVACGNTTRSPSKRGSGKPCPQGPADSICCATGSRSKSGWVSCPIRGLFSSP